MSVLYTAADCPALQYRTSLLDTSNEATPAAVAETVVAGESTTGLGKLARTSKKVDSAAIWGGAGIYAINFGLTLSAAGSLNMPVSAGNANIGGAGALPAGATVTQSTGIARAFQWATAGLGGLITVAPVNNSRVPPAGAQLYLGSVQTTGVVVSADTSGVPYFRGGAVWVQTADVGAPPTTGPSDSLAGALPATQSFFHRTAGGLYQWDGTRYTLADAGAVSDALNISIAALQLQQWDDERRWRLLLRYLFSGECGVPFDCPGYLWEDFSRAMTEQPF